MCPRAGSGQCSGCEKIIQLDHRVTNLEGWQRGSKKFHEDFYDYQRAQIERNISTDMTLKEMQSDIKELLAKKKEDEQRPSRSLDSIKGYIISSLISALVTFIVAYIGFAPK